ncbi:MAG: TRAP transporter small permease [Defluviicoccus sp.]|nr:TRAP transporter small permease [Defluviicoccus sp.]
MAIGPVLARLDRALSAVEAGFVAAAMAAASLLLFVNVILRYVFLSALSWAEEVTMYLIVWLVFVGGSVTLRMFGHISIDLLPLALPPGGARRLKLFVSCAMLIFFAAFFYYSGLHTLRVMTTGQLTPVLEAPMWLTYLAMPVGSLLMGIRTAQILYRTASAARDDASRPSTLAD